MNDGGPNHIDWHLPEEDGADFDDSAFEEAIRQHRREEFAALETLNR